MSDADNVTVMIWPAAVSAARLDALREILAPGELTRLDRMRDAVAREFVIGRGVVRELLAVECGCAPSDIAFGTSAHGKPFLQQPFSALAFNLSHSGGYYALATGNVTALGIDIEAIRTAVEDLSESVFTFGERMQYSALAPPDQMRAFFRGWVFKEAYLKATGEGLAGDLRSLEVDLTDGTSIRPIAIRGKSDALAPWQFRSFDIGDAIVGAVAMAARNASVKFRIRHLDPEQSLHR